MDLTTGQLGLLMLLWAIIQWMVQRRDAKSKLAESESEATKAVEAFKDTVKKKDEELAAERLRGDRLQSRVHHLEAICLPGMQQ